jgi:hypothetical protein
MQLPRKESTTPQNTVINIPIYPLLIIREDSYNPIYIFCEGFKEGRVACCGTGPYKGNLSGCCAKTVCDNVSDYLFFDGVHPTEKANYQFARLMWSGGADIVKPYNLKTLLKKI